jgi:hypothetical protein
VIGEYQKKLLLDRHDIGFEATSETSFMECAFRPPYLDTVIRYNPGAVKKYWVKKDLKALKHALVHELCHLLSDPFYDKAAERYVGKSDLEKERETMTDHIAMIIYKSGI